MGASYPGVWIMHVRYMCRWVLQGWGGEVGGLSRGLDMWALQGMIRGLPGSPDVHPGMDTRLENWTMFTFAGYLEQEWNLFSFPNPHNVNSFSSWVKITPFYVFLVCTLSSCVSWKIIFPSQWSIYVQNIEKIYLYISLDWGWKVYCYFRQERRQVPLEQIISHFIIVCLHEDHKEYIRKTEILSLCSPRVWSPREEKNNVRKVSFKSKPFILKNNGQNLGKTEIMFIFKA